MKRALISVSDKTGVVEFARAIAACGYEIISTGGTARTLKENGVAATEVSDLTGFPECLDGRVKTLHPVIHAGILAMRSKPEHMEQLKKLGIGTIDIVAINLYPFKATIMKEGTSFETAIENIDIGGPTMLRAAAKNHPDVAVVVDPADYERVAEEAKTEISLQTKKELALKVFEHTAAYDALIADYLRKQLGKSPLPDSLTLTFEKVQDMRYGENPHQQAAFYKDVTRRYASLADAKQLNGKELSFNNINDTNGALELLKEFSEPTVVGCKHGNPCGVSSAATVDDAWDNVFRADPVSIYGGIVTVNRKVTATMAAKMVKIFLEVVVAPEYDEEAIALFKTKPNVRILLLPDITARAPEGSLDMKKVNGGLIVQTIDSKLLGENNELKVVTNRAPTEKEKEDMLFAWKVCKFVKSNGIALAKNMTTVGIGPGQVNRVWAAKQSIDHAHELISPEATIGSVMASDAYFPFDDCVEAAHRAGITAIIQPGGSIRDNDSIKKCNDYGIAMVFTGMRHFRH